ncbi:MAG TPA: carbamoyl-phosphate synthase domain-containing protein, partial [Chloroflexota bacterium]|nr:carbamoyl-phosphate synthase domain-containing protein [Chloroflexota bacterium]
MSSSPIERFGQEGQQRQKLILALEDGRAFFGFSVGKPLEAEGELVFCTGMTGYQELCTDPSYRGQIVVLTYPLIDNYGINRDDFESTRPWLHGLIVREYCAQPSNWRANGQLAEWLAVHDIPVAEGFDTRALTRHLRTHGALRAVLAAPKPDALPSENGDAGMWVLGRTQGIQKEVERLAERARGIASLSEQALVAQVAGPQYERVDQSVWAPWAEPRKAAKRYRVVLIDCGVKHNIARSLARRGLDVQIVPYDAS